MQTKLRKVGSSLGVCLPKSIIDYMQIEEGRELCIVRTINGIELTKLSDQAREALEISQQVYRENEELFLLMAND